MEVASNSIELKDLKANLIEDKKQTDSQNGMGGQDTLAHENDQVNRPSTRGPYRPIRNGTIRGSIFAMLASALGTGCLNLPLRVQQLGILPFLLILLLCALLSYLGMYMMECVIIRYKVSSYSEMVKKAFGQKTMRLSQVVLIGYAVAISICFQVILAKFVVQILADLFGMDLYEDRGRQIYNSTGDTIRIVVSLLNVGLNFKHFFLTDLRQMLHTLGKFSVTGVVFCMSLIVITAFTGFTKYLNDQEIEYHSIFTMNYSQVELTKPIKSDYFMILLQGFSGVFYTFLNHQFIFPVISHLKKPSRKRVEKIFTYTHIEMIIVYVTIGLLGYLLLSQHEDIIPISPLVITSIPTLPLMLGKIMLIGALFFGLPLQIFTAREYLYQALDIQRDEPNLKKLNFWLIGGTLLISILFQKVNMYFGFIGGTTGVLMACIIPLACMYKLIAVSERQLCFMVLVLIMSVILFVGAIQSLFSTV